MPKNTINISRSEFVEKTLYLNGVPFSLADYPQLVTIYDDDAKDICLKFSRQASKSTTLAMLSVSRCAMVPYFRILYVSPTVDQTKIFSRERIEPVLQSPIIKNYYLSSSLIENVFMKQLLNGSRLYLRYALLDGSRLRGYSVSKDHQYLTARGWIDVEDLNYDDELLTLNESTKELEYQKPINIKIEDYDGPMHIYTSKGFRLEVTPDHRLHINRQKLTHAASYWTAWTTDLRAKDAHKTNFRMGIDEDLFYKDNSPKYFYLPKFKTNYKADGTPYTDGKIRTFKAIKLPIKEFMTFMGWWLSEGWTNLNTCSIGVAQDKKHNPAYWAEIKELFDKLFPGTYTILKNEISFHLNSEYRTLYEYLKVLGKSGDKYIPRELLNYTKYLPDLLDALYKGDGDNSKVVNPNYKKHLRLNTKSLSLANSVQEAWLKLGKLASIRHRIRRDIYTVEVKSKTAMNFLLRWRHYKSGGVEEIQAYKGKIYCVVVPNGNFITRHKKEKLPVITGNSSDMNLFDEAQDLRPEIIPVVQETKSRSLHKLTLYAGTPRRSRGTLADIWNRSSMNEFVLKCPSCNHWNILDEKNIGPTWVICTKCAANLIPQKGQWVSSYSLTQNYELNAYRLCALHFTGAPWIDWNADILLKQKNYPKAQFFNEVLALEYDEGVSPITKPQLQVLCNSEKPMLKEPGGIDASYSNILAVDYGPAASTKSNTVAVVLQRRPDKYHVLYAKKFTGHEADFAFLHDEIPRLMKVWNAKFIAADNGMGEATNSELRARVGFEKVIAFQHESAQREKVLWNKKLLAYTLNRTQAMTDVFSLLKNDKIEFPVWSDMETFMDDILNIQIEYDEQLGRMRYINIAADDFFHALVYGIFLCDFVEGNSLTT